MKEILARPLKLLNKKSQKFLSQSMVIEIFFVVSPYPVRLEYCTSQVTD